MFGLSTWELLIILVVALLFIGPDQLPKVARKLGDGMRQVRGAMTRVDHEVRRTIREATTEDALAEEEAEAARRAEADAARQHAAASMGHNAPPAELPPASAKAPAPPASATTSPASPAATAEDTDEAMPEPIAGHLAVPPRNRPKGAVARAPTQTGPPTPAPADANTGAPPPPESTS